MSNDLQEVLKQIKVILDSPGSSRIENLNISDLAKDAMKLHEKFYNLEKFLLTLEGYNNG